MSSYEGNPIGCLYERYQSSGVSPLYEVTMKKGQAHAPVFEAILSVPEGFKVSAQGNSKKIAKNLAAKMMLDKLDHRDKTLNRLDDTEMIKDKSDDRNTVKEEEEEGSEKNANIKVKVTEEILSSKADDDNNNPMKEEMETKTTKDDTTSSNTMNLMSPGLQTLASQPTAAASVTTFYYRLQRSQGPVLDNLHNGNICLAGDLSTEDYVPVLEMLAQEQQFQARFIQLESLDNIQQSLVQIITEGQDHPVTVCVGMGPYSKNFAARAALMYIKLMSRPDVFQEE